MCLQPMAALAQEPPPVPASATEPQGLLAEPAVVTRVALFADRRGSCLAGESSPPIGDRGVLRRPRPAYRPNNNLTDADVYPHGVC